MTRHRHVALLFALLAGVALTAGTSGVGFISVDRGIQVQMVEDENASLGFEATTRTTADGKADLNVTVTNQFPSGTSLTVVEVTINATTVDLAASDSLDSGESATGTFTSVPCGANLTVDARGAGVEVFLHRTVVC